MIPGSASVPLMVCVFPQPVAYRIRNISRQSKLKMPYKTHTISKYSCVVTLQQVGEKRFGCVLIHILLPRLVIKNPIKYEASVLVSLRSWRQETALHERP